MLETWARLIKCFTLKRVFPKIVKFFPKEKMTSMDVSDILKPPLLKDCKCLDREKFKKNITIPYFRISQNIVQKVVPLVKPYLLKMPKLKPVAICEEAKIYIDPTKVSNWEDFDEKCRTSLIEANVTKENLLWTDIQLSYDNWNADDILRAVLPPGVGVLRSYSKIGHIIHLNIRDHLLEFKTIIGEILLDKTPGAKTVVNKITKIDSTYRNFEMELVCGVNDMIAKVKENNHTFEFDFSKVYWNSRLSTEHQRIVDIIKPGSVLFDVFCGVGPFAIPCAKKQCLVFANDLNPECFKWLQHNITLNKVKAQFIHSFNKDGRDFIKSDLKKHLLILTKDNSFKGEVHVTMNLPALALDFILSFEKLFSKSDIAKEELIVIPTIHVYFFVTGDSPEHQAIVDFQEKTKISTDVLDLKYQYVRNVSPKKDMVRLSWKPPIHYIWTDEDDGGEPVRKRPR